MSSLQSRNEILLHYLRAQQIVSDPLLSRAWSSLQQCGGDLCQALIQQQVWTPEQARYYLEQARRAYQSGALSRSDSLASGLTALSPTPMSSNSALPQAPSSVALSPSLSGSSVGQAFTHPDYDIDSEISRGGMGVVFKARGKNDQQAVALKILKAKSPSVEFIERFKLEARALQGLDHPHIVKLHGYSSDSPTPFIAMEWVDGVSLDEKVREHLRVHGTVPPFDWTAKVHESIAKALSYCHERGLIHRDIKPANILIENETDRAVLVDFGLLKRDASQLKGDFQSIAEELTKSGLALGTPSYMAPEQLNDREVFGEIGPKVDVWGLGASLYFCLLGHPPYEGSSIQIYKALIERDPLPPGDENPELPLWLDELCQRCLTRESTDRPSTGEILGAFAQGDETLAAHRRLSKRLWLFPILTLILAAASVYWVSLDRTPPKILISKEAVSIGKEPLVLEGKVEDEEASHVLIQWQGKKKTLSLNDQGEFSITLNAPKKSTAKLKMLALDKSGNKSEGIAIKVKKDFEAPPFEIDGESPFITYDAELRLRGRCPEDGARVLLKGREAIVSEGRFEIAASIPMGESRLTLSCLDRLGNKSEKTFEVRRRPRVLVGDWSGRSAPAAVATYNSLKEALKSVKAQSQIMVAPGRYPGRWTVPRGLNSIEIVGAGRVEFVVQTLEAIQIDGQDIRLKSLIFSAGDKVKSLDVQVVKAFRLLTARGREIVLEDCQINESPGVGIFLSGPANKKLRENDDLTLRRCTLRGNALSSLQAESQSRVLIENCEFLEAGDIGLHALGCVVVIRNSLFQNNRYGSVVHLGSKLQFKKCRFLGSHKAGLEVSGVGSLATLSECLFEGNGKTADRGVYFDRQVNVTEQGSVIGRDTVIRGGFGTGVIARENSSLELIRCDVSDNDFSGVSVWGDSKGRLIDCKISRNGDPKYGGPYHGFGLDARDKSVVTVKNCQFDKNAAKAIFTYPETTVIQK